MKRRVVIKNKFRFIFFVTVMVLVASMGVGLMFPASAAQPKVKEFKEVKVAYGDTLWQLAKTYGDHSKDVREVIYDICEYNNISESSVYPGMTIAIPAEYN